MRIFAAAVGGLLGGVVGYFIGAYIGCYWLYPTSNLCGIYGVFSHGPLGLVGGDGGGLVVCRDQEQSSVFPDLY